MQALIGQISTGHGGALSHLGGIVRSFRWAMAVRNDCERWTASGRRLDGEAITRIAGAAERRLEERS